MKTVSISVYSFSELSEVAQKKAIDNLRDINTDTDWHEFVYEDFAQLCEYLGIEVDLSKTYFNGFSHQGSGSSFTAEVDFLKFINAVKGETWKEYAPNEILNFPAMDLDHRIIRLIEVGYISVNLSIAPANRETAVSVELSFDFNNGNWCPNIDSKLSDFERTLKESAGVLNRFLYKSLEKEYEYLTSDEAIKETILANEYNFLETGELY